MTRPEWTRGIIDALAWLGIGADDPVFEGPYFQSANAGSTSPRPSACYAADQALLLRPDQRTGPGPLQGNRQARLRRLLPRPGLEPGRAGCWVPGCRRVTTVVHDAIHGDVTFAHDFAGGLRPPARQRPTDFVLANVVDESRWASPRRPRRGAPAEHPQAAVAVAGARPRAAPVGHIGPRERVPQEARPSDGQGRAGAVPRRRLPGRRDGQLPDDAGLGAERRHRDRPVVADRGRDFRLEDVTQLPGVLRPQEAQTPSTATYIRAMPVEAFIEACGLDPRALRPGPVRRRRAAPADRGW